MIELNNFAKEIGIDFICTAFDISSAEFIATRLDCKAFKLASSDLCNISLLDYFKQLSTEYQRPLILSTGGATFDDIEWALEYVKNYCVNKNLKLVTNVLLSNNKAINFYLKNNFFFHSSEVTLHFWRDFNG